MGDVMNKDPKTEIYFCIDGQQHALRCWRHVPRKGDEVRLRGGLYSVERVIWVSDGEASEHVVIDMAPISLDDLDVTKL